MGSTTDIELMRRLAAELPLEALVDATREGDAIAAEVKPLFEEVHVRSSGEDGDALLEKAAKALRDRPACFRLEAADAVPGAIERLHPQSVVIVAGGLPLGKLAEVFADAAPDHRVGAAGELLVLLPPEASDAVLAAGGEAVGDEDAGRRLGRLDQHVRTTRATVGRLRDEQGATATAVAEMRGEIAAMRSEVGGLRKDVMSARRLVSLRRFFRPLVGPLQRLRARWSPRVRRLTETSPKLGRLEHHPPIPLQIPERYRNGQLPSDPPTISIVTPSFNQGRFLRRTIESVLGQEYPSLEYVVQDGGSDDETRMILERYDGRLHHWEMRKDEGQGHAINLGMARTTGEVMAYLNSDDVLLPGALRYVARYFEEHPKVDAIYGHRVLIDERDREIGRWVLPRHGDEILSWADFVPQETLFWRRRLWNVIGGRMDEDFRFALDWDLLLRFRDARARIVRVPRFLGAFRVHRTQKTSADWDTAGETEMALIRVREHDREVDSDEVGRQLRWYLRRHVVLHKLYRAGVLRY